MMSPILLPSNYQVGPYDVICALNKEARTHPGNIRFRKFIDEISEEYHSPEVNKAEKSKLLTRIINYVRDYGGSFVKRDTTTHNNNDNQWYDVGDSLARGKVGQCLRSKTYGKYRSSTYTKRIMRKEMNNRLEQKVALLLTKNESIANEIQKLQNTINEYHQHLSSRRSQFVSSDMMFDKDEDDYDDEELEHAMTNANIRVLDSLKKDYYESSSMCRRHHHDQILNTNDFIDCRDDDETMMMV